jgi:hypothetical protein
MTTATGSTSHHRRSTHGANHPIAIDPNPTRTSATGDAGHVIVAPGNDDPYPAMSRIGSAAHPAPHAAIRPIQGAIHATPAAANPITVAGPTNGPARAFAGTPTTLTAPDSAVTSGCVATCAAKGTATASASHPGNHRPSASAHFRRPHQTMPTHAATESANPHDRDNQGSTKHSPMTATDMSRRPPPDPASRPTAAKATTPIAAARTTLGSALHSATNTMTVTDAHQTDSHRPRTPHHRATSTTNARSSARLAPAGRKKRSAAESQPPSARL